MFPVGVAVANLHPDTMLEKRAPEIVAFLGGSHVVNSDREIVERRPFIGAVAFRRTSADGGNWEELWRNTEAPHFESRGPRGSALHRRCRWRRCTRGDYRKRRLERTNRSSGVGTAASRSERMREWATTPLLGQHLRLPTSISRRHDGGNCREHSVRRQRWLRGVDLYVYVGELPLRQSIWGATGIAPSATSMTTTRARWSPCGPVRCMCGITEVS